MFGWKTVGATNRPTASRGYGQSGYAPRTRKVSETQNGASWFRGSSRMLIAPFCQESTE
jgi:hypothetical protein